MNGFIVTHRLHAIHLPESYCWKPLFDFQQEHVLRSVKQSDYYAEQFTPDRFQYHKFFIDEDDYLLITEGIITNLKELYKHYQCTSGSELFRMMSQTDPQFFSQLHGNFAGYYLHKPSGKILTFNNQTGTRKLFYYKDNDYLVISTDLGVLATTMSGLSKSISLDTKAAWMLLSYGFMLEDYTLLNEVKQIIAGQFIYFEKQQLIKQHYFHLTSIQRKKSSSKEIIQQLESCFQLAVKEEYSIDKEYGYNSTATLSGGLDSRMTVLMAEQLGYKQQLINFSQKGYADEVIANEIAVAYQLRLDTVELTETSLIAIDEIIRINDGMSVYTGAGHVLQALRKLNYPNRGILHTGMLGDAILGSYLTAPHDTTPGIHSGAYSQRIPHDALPLFTSIAKKYPSEELFKFYNRAFQGINNGFLFLNLFSESLSPFMHPDFLKLALSIPHSYTYKERIYIDWIRKLHPEWAEFSWENIGGKPTNNHCWRFLYRAKRAFIKRLPIASMWKHSMTPEQNWYNQSERVRTTLDTYYNQHIEHPILQASLKSELQQLYSTGSITEKAQVITLLGAIKHLFP
jgi:asparagine synthase (glutamine-hydrolysing)